MQRSDYILRLVRQMGEVLSGIAALRRSGQNQEALRAVEEALQGFFSLSLSVADSLTADALESLVRLYGRGQTEPGAMAGQLTALGLLLQEAGDAYAAEGDAGAAARYRLKALDIHLSVLTQDDPDAVASVAAVDELVHDLADYELSALTKERLWQHYEHTGHFALAENWLFEALDTAGASGDLIVRGLAFYRRLLDRPDADLAQGNLPRDEVLAGLAELQARPRG